MADDSQDMLSRLIERLEKLDRERERLRIAIQVIRGDESTDEGTSASGPVPTETPIDVTDTVGPPRRVEIRPDTYFGLSQHQAAKRYLQTLGHADRIENIHRAITSGGVAVGGANPILTLRAIMAQNTSVFVRVGPGTFGLREFYPKLGTKTEPRRPKIKRTEKRKNAESRSVKKANSAQKREGRDHKPGGTGDSGGSDS